MIRALRISAWSFGGLLLGLAVLAAGLTIWLRTSLPVTSGTITAPGLAADAVIARDANGLVHIRAANAGDAYFALGYAHAQDRLWQMEATRRFGTGRLAEIAGERFLAQDRLMRTLGVGRLAEAALDVLSPKARAGVEAYARGVNAWIAGHRAALPPEFALARHAPEPWRAADSLIWGRIMAMNLSGNWRRQLNRARIDRRLGREQIERLDPPYPADAPVTVTDGGGPRSAAVLPEGAGATPAAVAAPAALLDALAAALPPAPAADTASNSWVLDGSRTASGKPILGNDPHLGLRAPNVWYLARIEVPGLTLAGATAPGVPFHVLGHNGAVAWGLTTTGADVQDLVIEKLAPGDPTRYLAPDGPRAFATREETIKLRGGDVRRIVIRETRNGPVVSDLAEDAAELAGAGAVIALRSPVLATDDATAEALYRINRARDWRDFTAALERFHAPVQNIFYADTAGHIGFSVAGRVPLRRNRDGALPADGTDAGHDWAGYIAPDRLPRGFDPPQAYFANANNRVVGPNYPHLIARVWEPPHRALRLRELLEAPGIHDMNRSRAIQMDVISVAARDLLPRLLHLTPREGANAALLDRLRGWDGAMGRDRPEPLIFTAWMVELTRALFADELGPLFDDVARLRPLTIEKALTADTAWCDDVATPAREDCASRLGVALSAARETIARAQGPDPAAWRWGRAHRASLRNAALDWLPVLGRYSRIVIATDGDDFTLNRGTSGFSRRRGGFDHVHGATLRAIYDLADLDGSLFAVPGGQSGNPLAPHYRDLTRPWRDGEYLRLPAGPEGPVRILRLMAAPNAHPGR